MAAKSKTLKNGLDRDVCYSQATPTTMAIQIKFLWMKGETVIARPPSINWSLGLYQGFDIPQYWQNFGKYLILLQSTTVKQVKLRRQFLSLSLTEIKHPVFKFSPIAVSSFPCENILYFISKSNISLQTFSGNKETIEYQFPPFLW